MRSCLKTKHNNSKYQAWWHVPVIPALGRWRQEDHEFESGLGILVIFLTNVTKYMREINNVEYSYFVAWFQRPQSIAVERA